MRPVSSTRWFRILLPFLVAIPGLIIAYLLSDGLTGYFVYLGITVVVSVIALMGLGIVTGSAGMIALCQLTFAAVGAWIVSGMNYLAHDGQVGGGGSDPGSFFGGYIVWLLLGGAGAALVGVIIGLPALRLRGVSLAVVTLAFAAAADATLVMIQFPGSTKGIAVTRPEMFSDDRSFFFFACIVLVVCAIVMYFLQAGRWGSSWKAVAFSERGTAVVGQRVAGAKLSAFAVSAAFGGIAGGLIAGQVGLAFASSFTPLQSLALYVLSIMAGAHLIDMAIFGGILWVLVPELLRRWGIPQDWAFVIFGALGVQALTSGTTLGQAIRNSWWKRRRKGASTTTLAEEAATGTSGHADVPDRAGEPPSQPAAADAAQDGSSPAAPAPDGSASGAAAQAQRRAPVLQIRGLGVRFGNVQALDGVDLAVPERTVMGLIGPNGAGKSTFVDALTGFLPQHTGTITLDGRRLRSASPTARARLGLRRTFQQDRVPPRLTIDSYLRFVARRRVSLAEIDEVLDFFGCPPGHTRLLTVDVGTRRLVEVAANVLARPKVLLLDEPAAGLSHDEHVALGDRLRSLPDRYGLSVVLIEHDLEMVRSVCRTITVLDFGEVIASGPQEKVLADPEVLKAYMGETELT